MSTAEEEPELSRANLTFAADDHIEVELPPIRAFGRPVAVTSTDLQAAKPAFLQLPGCTSPRDLSSRADMSRVEDAVQEGQHHLQRIPSNNDEVLTRKQENSYFPKECTLLDQLLARVQTTVVGPGAYAYAVEAETLLQLSELLIHRRRTASESLLLRNAPVPELPRWGPLGDPNTFWLLNEFEILGACYRREVECYLAYLSRHHQFLPMGSKKTKKDNPGKRSGGEKAGNEPETPRTSTPRRRTALERDDGYRTPGRVGWNQEIEESIGSSVETVRAQRKAHRSQRFSDTFFAPTATSSATMRELFGRTQRELPAHIPEEDEDEGNEPEDGDEEDSPPPAQPIREGNPPDPGDGDDDDDDDGNGPGNGRTPSRKPTPPNKPSRTPKIAAAKPVASDELKFDTKLKRELIPEWDGDTDVLAHWILRINEGIRYCFQTTRPARTAALERSRPEMVLLQSFGLSSTVRGELG